MKDPSIRKLYYSISEVSKMTGLEQYVLRYWETEFEQLKPAKNRAGNRIYTSKDIKLILFIKKLLREERYTIEGAKQVLHQWREEDMPDLRTLVAEQSVEASEVPAPPVDPNDRNEDLKQVRYLLMELLAKLG
jgi:DNA-binding transcriptional MerR regulator